jgi:membrane protease subunit (stomatin/prohibitin family)
MSIVEKLRGELIDIVEWVDDNRHTLVWRFPRYHNQIKNGAKLIVRPGQEAVFVHKGRIADVFRPGTHTLATGNLPVLSTLQGWKHGFDSPFKAEIYFVTTRQLTELKWGTPHPVIMRDPDFGAIRIRAFGTYTLTADDPKVLLRELVGTNAEFDAEEIGVLLRSIINSCFADLVANSGISVIDLASNYAALSEKLRRAVCEKIDDEYGLDIPQLYLVNVSLPPEVEKALDARSSLGILGDLGQYQQYQIGSSLPLAAANPAGGLAGAGLGLGMGWALTSRMIPGGDGNGGSAFSSRGNSGNVGTGAGGDSAIAVAGDARSLAGGSPGGPGQATHAPASQAASWYTTRGGRTYGPFTLPQLAAAASTGEFRPETLAWTVGMTGWTPAEQVPELSRFFRAGPPPAPPPVP